MPWLVVHCALPLIVLTGRFCISRRTVGDNSIKVAYDQEAAWPIEWYMREFPNNRSGMPLQQFGGGGIVAGTLTSRWAWP